VGGFFLIALFYDFLYIYALFCSLKSKRLWKGGQSRLPKQEDSMFGLRYNWYMRLIATLDARHFLLFYGSVLILAPCIAFMEIATEGPYGWAENAWNYGQVLDKTHDKPQTYYHAAMNLVYFVAVNLAFWRGEKWEWSTKILKMEAKVVSWIFMMWVVEDFLWFMMNPTYGLSKFGPEYIWWHKTWFLGVPNHYFPLFFASLILYLFSYRPIRD